MLNLYWLVIEEIMPNIASAYITCMSHIATSYEDAIDGQLDQIPLPTAHRKRNVAIDDNL